jgi:hypothetical protein
MGLVVPVVTARTRRQVLCRADPSKAPDGAPKRHVLVLDDVGFSAISCYAADLGCWDGLMLVHRLLQRGNGADRQRGHERDGGLGLVLRRLADETARGRATPAPPSERDRREQAVEMAA